MKRPLAFLTDGLRNLASNLMTPRDKQAHSEYVYTPLSMGQLVNIYRSSWLPQKIVDIPANDACRAWREWDGKTEAVQSIEAEETRLNVRLKVRDAMVAARLYGGAALYIGVGDNDLTQPLDPKRITKGGLRALVHVPMASLNRDMPEEDIESPWFGQPKMWSFSTHSQQMEVHPSRFIFFHGHKTPDISMLPSEFWGDSILQAVIDAVKQSDATVSNVASLVFEAKVDVLAIPGLMDEIQSPEYEKRLLDRLAIANLSKGINGMLVRDAEETYEQKKMQFSTIPEVMDRFFQNVAGAADIPMTRLFGMSPGGMNSTGDSDLLNYYDKIHALQETDMRPSLALLDEVLVRSALGATPRKPITYRWRPLWQVSKKDLAEISKSITETLVSLGQSGLYTHESLGQVGIATHQENGILSGANSLVKEKKPDPVALTNPDGTPATPPAPGETAPPANQEGVQP